LKSFQLIIPNNKWISKGIAVNPKAQVSDTGFEDNPLRGSVKLAYKGA